MSLTESNLRYAVAKPFATKTRGLGFGAGRPADRSLVDGGCWQTATFTVPSTVPDARVTSKLVTDKYRRRFGDYLTRVGFEVLYMGEPKEHAGPLPDPPDRRRYAIRAWCTRRPIETTLTVPDAAVPEMLRRGLRLSRTGN